MKKYKERAEKVESRIQELGKFSDEPDCLSRVFGTKAFMDCRDKIESWMKEAGLETYVDNVGNIRGKLLSANEDAKTFVIASHYDTVIDAGKYDGALGILAGLDLLEHLIAEKISLPFNIELIAFSEEEGVRFPTSYLGSKVVAGSFNEDILKQKDNDGISLGEVLQNLRYDASKILEDAIPAVIKVCVSRAPICSLMITLTVQLSQPGTLLLIKPSGQITA